MTSAAVARRVARVPLVSVAVFALVAAWVPSAASAFGAVGSDPASNIAPAPYPEACWQAPTGSTCEAAAVASLQQSRAAMGQPAYALPTDFAMLSAASQALILTNLDRALYGLPPVFGLTAALGADAAYGVVTDSDPSPRASDWTGWTANWAGGMPNMPAAYQMWMYDDGAGAGNLDCPYAGASGCWGHRHDVLWQFDSTGPLVMGAAAGFDRGRLPGFAMLLVSERSSVSPAYTYTWAQAVADGAGAAESSVAASGASASAGSTASVPPSVPAPAKGTGSTGGPSAGQAAGAGTTVVRPSISGLTVRGRRISATVSARAGATISCSLSLLSDAHSAGDRFVPCSASFAWVSVPNGRYRLRVRVGTTVLTRFVVVR